MLFNHCNCDCKSTPLYESFFNSEQIILTKSSPYVNTNSEKSIYLDTANKIIKKKDLDTIVNTYNDELKKQSYPSFGNFEKYNQNIVSILNYNNISWNISWNTINNNFNDIYINLNKFKSPYRNIYKSSIQFVKDINKILFDLKYNQKHMIKNKIVNIYKSNNYTKYTLHVVISAENDILYYLFEIDIIIGNNKTYIYKMSYLGSGTTDELYLPNNNDSSYYSRVLEFGSSTPRGVNQMYNQQMINFGQPFQTEISSSYHIIPSEQAEQIYTNYLNQIIS